MGNGGIIRSVHNDIEESIPSIPSDDVLLVESEQYSNIINSEDNKEVEIESLYIPPIPKIISHNKLHPIIFWDIQSPITYLEPLTKKNHLSSYAKDFKTRIVEGLSIYNHYSGDILSAGTHIISLTFIPKKSKYLSVTQSKELIVRKRRPVVTWTGPLQEIEYGTLLKELIFTGISCELKEGTYNFSHSVGLLLEIGIHTITVEYEPSKEESLNYCRGYAAYAFKVIGRSVPLKWEVPFHKETYDLYTNYNIIATYNNLDIDMENSSTDFKQNVTYIAHSIPVGKNGPSFIPGAPIIYPEPLPYWIYTAVPVESAILTIQDNEDYIAGEMRYDIPVGTVLSAGKHILTATYYPVNKTKYRPCSVTYEVLILKSPVELIWNQSIGMTEGAMIDESALNCTNSLNIPGTYTYDPPVGTFLLEGRYTLSVLFEPIDAMNYHSNQTTTQFHVRHKKIPGILWTPPIPIVHPFPLSKLQLNAACRGGAYYKGEYKYEPDFNEVLDAGEHLLKVTFYPELPTVAITTLTVSITVYQGMSRLIWNNPEPLYEGEGLFDNVLNCKCTNLSDGEFIYTPAKGTTALFAGKHKLFVRYIPDSKNYMEVETSVSILIKPRLKSKYAAY